MDPLVIALRALGDYQQTVDTLLRQVADLERQLAETRAVANNGTPAPTDVPEVPV